MPHAEAYEDRPVTDLYRVGSAMAAKLERLGVVSIKDLLFHLPYRYEDRTRIAPLNTVVAGTSALVAGRIVKVDVRFRGRRALIVQIDDGTGRLAMRLFHFSSAQQRQLEAGKWLRCYGEVRGAGHALEMVHPEYSVLHSEPGANAGSTLTSIYSLTEGLTQGQLRSLIAGAAESARGRLPELIPQSELNRLTFPDLDAALEIAHAPPLDEVDLDEGAWNSPAMRRLAFEELLSNQLARRWLKRRRQKFTAPAMNPAGDLSHRLRASLPFEPTRAQRLAIREIIGDLRKPVPMLRLVQGDVGSGKTLVAAAAAAWAVDAGYQFAMMAPTELLAEQHMKSFTQWFAPLGVDVLILTGGLSAKDRRLTQSSIEAGNADIVVGTHALFQSDIRFKKLGLVVVDEQHRFGVGQRYALREKGVIEDQVPHQIIMTATPIPRSLAMTFYADLDVSSIKELPPGRTPPQTRMTSSNRRGQVIEQVRRICAGGGQAYWVCPFIDKSEFLDVEAAADMEETIRRALPEFSVALVHGRMKGSDRDRIMDSFRAGDVHVLVATTVIEVGVDVPNASLMIIENAERLGLAQLHQLRGRVGRGSDRSHCVLIHSNRLSSMAKERLAVMLETNDGFKIAETDMRLRGAGELLGTRQTGAKMFRVADLPRDVGLIPDVGETAGVILDRHPELVRPLIRRWMPNDGNYGDV